MPKTSTQDAQEAAYARRWGRIGYGLREHQLRVMGFQSGESQEWDELGSEVRAALRTRFDATREPRMLPCPACRSNELNAETPHLRLCLFCGAFYSNVDGKLTRISNGARDALQAK